MRSVLRGGRVVDTATRSIFAADVVVEGGRIERVVRETERPETAEWLAGAQVFDVNGCLVAPGFIDLHCHLREPGREDAETIETGTRAAAAGGFTTVCAMPNTNPPIDTQAGVEFVKARAAATATVHVIPFACVTKGRAGVELTEIADLVSSGARAVSDDGTPIANAEVMRRALEYASMFGIPVIPHCEDPHLVKGGSMNEGYMSTVLGLKGMPAAAEEAMVARDLILARLAGGRLHVAHVSCQGSLDLIRRAKDEGLNVTCEVTPHHLTLTEEAVASFDTSTKTAPPLRSATDMIALRKALRDGTVDAIATDHAPHTTEDKDVEFDYAPFGASVAEAGIPAVMTDVVAAGELDLVRMVEALTVGPARVLGLEPPRIAEQAPADMTVVDPELVWEVTPGALLSKGKNCPYLGRRLKGRPVLVMVAGQVVHQEARLMAGGAGLKR